MKIKIKELCPRCDNENSFEWDTEKNGYVAACRFCMEELLLCEQCLADGGICDKTRDTDLCRGYRIHE